MNITEFSIRFGNTFTKDKLFKPTAWYKHRFWRKFFDSCPNVQGMISVKKQKLLNIAFSCLNVDECYLEIGTYLGKSLISAVLENPERKVYACDNFSQLTSFNSFEKLQSNLCRYKLDKKVTFYNSDFLKILNKDKIPISVGLYHYDGAHDENSQYLAIKNVEPLLSNEALIIVDDWRFAEDSKSYAKAGTEKAITESLNKWKVLYNLPARYNGDHAMWWNGVCVLSFKRQKI